MSLRVLILDKTDSLTPWWDIGSSLGYFDEVIRAGSWADAADDLSALVRVTHLQIWGHGSPGKSYINNHSMPASFDEVLKSALSPAGLVWFRQCAVFAGPSGIAFAKRIAGLNLNTAGHTRNISTPSPIHHSGGCAVAPGKSPRWSTTEGFNKKTGNLLGSTPFAKNTILATTMTVPRKWWAERK